MKKKALGTERQPFHTVRLIFWLNKLLVIQIIGIIGLINLISQEITGSISYYNTIALKDINIYPRVESDKMAAIPVADGYDVVDGLRHATVQTGMVEEETAEEDQMTTVDWFLAAVHLEHRHGAVVVDLLAGRTAAGAALSLEENKFKQVGKISVNLYSTFESRRSSSCSFLGT